MDVLTRRARPEAPWLLVAALLLGLSFLLQLVEPSNAARIGAFYTLPVIIAAVTVGLRAALLTGFLAIGLDLTSGLVAGTPLIDHWPRAVVLLAVALVTSRLAEMMRSAHLASQRAERRFRRAFDDSHVGMALVALGGERTGMIAEANQALCGILGMEMDDLVGKVSIAEFVRSEDVVELRGELASLQAGTIDMLDRELTIVRPDGDTVWVQFTTSIVHDDEGAPEFRLSQIENIDARKRAEERLVHLADHDELTGLPNRRRFERELEAELDSGLSRGAVVVCDLDNFKQVNDALGHGAGDEVLRSVARILRSAVRSGDLVARLGGDEFGVLLRRASEEEARRVTAKLVDQVAIGLAIASRTDAAMPVTLSAGITAFGEGAQPGTGDLLRTADAGMYRAKREGGSRAALLRA